MKGGLKMKRAYIPMMVMVLIICLSGVAVGQNYLAVDYDVNGLFDLMGIYGKGKALVFSAGFSAQDKWYIDGSYRKTNLSELSSNAGGPFWPIGDEVKWSFSDMHIAGNYILFEEKGTTFSIGLAGLYRTEYIYEDASDWEANILGLGAKASGRMELKNGVAISGNLLWGPSFALKVQTEPELIENTDMGGKVLSFSVGAEYALSDNYLLRAGYRYTYGEMHCKDIPNSELENTYQTLYVGVGFNL